MFPSASTVYGGVHAALRGSTLALALGRAAGGGGGLRAGCAPGEVAGDDVSTPGDALGASIEIGVRGGIFLDGGGSGNAEAAVGGEATVAGAPGDRPRCTRIAAATANARRAVATPMRICLKTELVSGVAVFPSTGIVVD